MATARLANRWVNRANEVHHGGVSSTAFERDAISEFIDKLNAQRYAHVQLVSHPEDHPAEPLTVDAVALDDGELWAIDHMRLAYEPTVVPAGDEADRRLRRPLEKLAEEHGCCLYVGVLPPRRVAGRIRIDAYYANVLSRAEQAVTGGEDWFDIDGFTSVQVVAHHDTPNARAVELATWFAGTGSVEEQVDAALKTPLLKKLDGQLAVAKAAGYRVMLLVDQVRDVSRRQPTVFLASWQTVKIVVDRIVALHRDVLDCVWFRAGDGSFTNLTTPAEG